ncbi:hypothetical protein L596_021496 [Steinernema carpocapsae]|uniref:Uncharacterized protein n=1 Tax=Steinernema carpocapsae TaxID=34508 RepID=A0A4U5MIW1_STECR|nr:hypothetical protein L596_021496 [Steinernema carpocapsae]
MLQFDDEVIDKFFDGPWFDAIKANKKRLHVFHLNFEGNKDGKIEYSISENQRGRFLQPRADAVSLEKFRDCNQEPNYVQFESITLSSISRDVMEMDEFFNSFLPLAGSMLMKPSKLTVKQVLSPTSAILPRVFSELAKFSQIMQMTLFYNGKETYTFLEAKMSNSKHMQIVLSGDWPKKTEDLVLFGIQNEAFCKLDASSTKLSVTLEMMQETIKLWTSRQNEKFLLDALMGYSFEDVKQHALDRLAPDDAETVIVPQEVQPRGQRDVMEFRIKNGTGLYNMSVEYSLEVRRAFLHTVPNEAAQKRHSGA